MAEVVLDVIEQILVRLDGIDLLRCKSVCKSCLSLIPTPLFVKSHLNYTCINNYNLPDRRIIMLGACSFFYNGYHIVGSSNGLVCISPTGVELLVTNPLTREVKYLPGLPDKINPKTTRPRFSDPCWGFGYDASIDDYKVILGIGIGGCRTRFHVLALKSNIWKPIGDIGYKLDSPSATTNGILCEGSLHWFMNDRKNKKVTISFNLSLEEFKEIPRPDNLESPLAYCGSLRIKDYMAAPMFVESLVSPHGNITSPIKTTNDNKALKRKRRHAKNNKTVTVLHEEIRMQVIDPKVRASYQYVPPNKVIQPTPNEMYTYQSGTNTNYVCFIYRVEGIILIPRKGEWRSPECFPTFKHLRLK
ncbi:F-box/kelch-repeat protein-like protein isoform X1 [Tanacetum coccineum]